VARSLAHGETAEQLLQIQRDLFVAGAELATAPSNRS
jgi:cob(I)alamin adenosyltransferase